VIEDDEKFSCSSFLFGWGRAVVAEEVEEEDTAANPPTSSSCCSLLRWTGGLEMPVCMLSVDKLSLLLFLLRKAKGVTRGVVEGEEEEGQRGRWGATTSCSLAKEAAMKALPVCTSSSRALPGILRSSLPSPVLLSTSASASWAPASALSGGSTAVAGNGRCGLQVWGQLDGGFSSLKSSISNRLRAVAMEWGEGCTF
jgi:hypothetical protein